MPTISHGGDSVAALLLQGVGNLMQPRILLSTRKSWRRICGRQLLIAGLGAKRGTTSC